MAITLEHLDLLDPRRGDLFADIECRECAHNGGARCGNAVVVLDAMRSRGNDMSLPVFDFTPDGDANASQCPGMFPSEDYLRSTGQSAYQPATERPSYEDVMIRQMLVGIDKTFAAIDAKPTAAGEEAA